MPAFFASTNPFVPYHTSAGQKKIIKFGGLLETEFLEPPPGRCFLFRQTYKKDLRGPVPENLRRLIASSERPKGPPLHFHQYQTEYFKVEQGLMGIERDGKIDLVTPETGEVSAKPGQIHQFFIHDDSPGDMTVLLSASDSGKDYQLDRIFFENWYGYWHDALLFEGGLNIFQFLSIQDGGDAYSVPPSWIPMPNWLRRTIGYWGSVAGGRWIGGLLGYKPFFKEYTTDWDFAVAKMKGSYFQRHLVEEAYKSEKDWNEQTRLSPKENPTNAEYQRWIEHMVQNEEEKAGSVANGLTNGVSNGVSNGTPNGAETHETDQELRLRKLSKVQAVSSGEATAWETDKTEDKVSQY